MKGKVQLWSMQMGGLQTRQYVDIDYYQSGDGVSGNFAINTGTPVDFATNWAAVTNGSDEKVYIRSMSHDTIIHSGSNVPIICKAWLVKCRKLNALPFTTLLADNAPVITAPMIDVTTSNAFRRYFKILRRRNFQIQPGYNKRLKLKLFYRRPKAISGDIEGNLNYNYSPMTYVWFVTFCGSPCEGASAGLHISLPPTKVEVLHTSKCTYYIPEDNDPSSVLSYTNPGPDSSGYKEYTDTVLQPTAEDG